MREIITLITNLREELVDITDAGRAAVQRSGIRNGVVHL